MVWCYLRKEIQCPLTKYSQLEPIPSNKLYGLVDHFATFKFHETPRVRAIFDAVGAKTMKHWKKSGDWFRILGLTLELADDVEPNDRPVKKQKTAESVVPETVPENDPL